MRDPVDPSALPRSPTPTGGDVTGLRVPRNEVRCPIPGCGRKLAEALTGTLTIRCDRCRHLLTITRPLSNG